MSYKSKPVSNSNNSAHYNNSSSDRYGERRFRSRTGIVIPNRVFVGGITSSISESELRDIFGRYGIVKAARIVNNADGVPKGYGFITYESEEEVKRLMNDVDNVVFRDRRLNIAPAIINKKDTPCSSPPPSPVDASSPSTSSIGSVYYTNGVPFTYQNGMAFFANGRCYPATAAAPITVMQNIAEAASYYPAYAFPAPLHAATTATQAPPPLSGYVGSQYHTAAATGSLIYPLPSALPVFVGNNPYQSVGVGNTAATITGGGASYIPAAMMPQPFALSATANSTKIVPQDIMSMEVMNLAAATAAGMENGGQMMTASDTSSNAASTTGIQNCPGLAQTQSHTQPQSHTPHQLQVPQQLQPSAAVSTGQIPQQSSAMSAGPIHQATSTISTGQNMHQQSSQSQYGMPTPSTVTAPIPMHLQHQHQSNLGMYYASQEELYSASTQDATLQYCDVSQNYTNNPTEENRVDYSSHVAQQSQQQSSQDIQYNMELVAAESRRDYAAAVAQYMEQQELQSHHANAASSTSVQPASAASADMAVQFPNAAATNVAGIEHQTASHHPHHHSGDNGMLQLVSYGENGAATAATAVQLAEYNNAFVQQNANLMYHPIATAAAAPDNPQNYYINSVYLATAGNPTPYMYPRSNEFVSDRPPPRNDGTKGAKKKFSNATYTKDSPPNIPAFPFYTATSTNPANNGVNNVRNGGYNRSYSSAENDNHNYYNNNNNNGGGGNGNNYYNNNNKSNNRYPYKPRAAMYYNNNNNGGSNGTTTAAGNGIGGGGGGNTGYYPKPRVFHNTNQYHHHHQYDGANGNNNLRPPRNFASTPPRRYLQNIHIRSSPPNGDARSYGGGANNYANSYGGGGPGYATYQKNRNYDSNSRYSAPRNGPNNAGGGRQSNNYYYKSNSNNNNGNNEHQRNGNVMSAATTPSSGNSGMNHFISSGALDGADSAPTVGGDEETSPVVEKNNSPPPPPPPSAEPAGQDVCTQMQNLNIQQ